MINCQGRYYPCAQLSYCVKDCCRSVCEQSGCAHVIWSKQSQTYHALAMAQSYVMYRNILSLSLIKSFLPLKLSIFMPTKFFQRYTTSIWKRNSRRNPLPYNAASRTHTRARSPTKKKKRSADECCSLGNHRKLERFGFKIFTLNEGNPKICKLKGFLLPQPSALIFLSFIHLYRSWNQNIDEKFEFYLGCKDWKWNRWKYWLIHYVHFLAERITFRK